MRGIIMLLCSYFLQRGNDDAKYQENATVLENDEGGDVALR